MKTIFKLLLLALLAAALPVLAANPDLNGDGKVNSTDVSLLTTFVKARGKDVVLH